MKKYSSFIYLFLILFMSTVFADGEYYALCHEQNRHNVVYKLTYLINKNIKERQFTKVSQLVYEGKKQYEAYEAKYAFTHKVLSLENDHLNISLYKGDLNEIIIQFKNSDWLENKEPKHIAAKIMAGTTFKSASCYINYTAEDDLTRVSDINLNEAENYMILGHPLIGDEVIPKEECCSTLGKCCSAIAKCCSAIGRCIGCDSGGLSDSEYTSDVSARNTSSHNDNGENSRKGSGGGLEAPLLHPATSKGN